MFLYSAVGYHADRHGLRSFVPPMHSTRRKTREPLLFARPRLQVEAATFFSPRAVHEVLPAGTSAASSRGDVNTCVEAKGVWL